MRPDVLSMFAKDNSRQRVELILTVYIIDTPFNTFANGADPDQAALVRAAWSGSTLFAYGHMIYLTLH